MDKTLKFDIFRFHLLPITTKQTSLFGENITYEELVQKKNEVFNKFVEDLQNINTGLPLELFSYEDDSFLFRIANPKKTIIYKDFKEIVEKTEPYVFLAINTNDDVQKIGISHNPEAFSTTTVTKNAVLKIFNKYLNQNSLSIELEQIFEENKFWSVANKYQGRIKLIDFEIIKPNMSRISQSIKATLKPLIQNTNSHKTHVKLSAPEQGVLENIDKENKQVEGLVSYSSEGGGNITMKVLGLKSRIKTKNMAKTKKINELQLKGSPEQIIKVWKDIVE
ncbi:hypothetical protein [Croceibacter atlanticus]|jgi:hypothetical protein|uniref:Uncharacterized protein n=1 Tax=Croceibacter atlanticus (strain ATCC BAA-628 / JCM 21780 / CIP 108009 / IAM 15332 / KCTC 12090 / HTCC2559) TaxID=216432 RepID=A3U6S6_CROAH|nr:hypothetical protein [Croceibacter atlanticus]EAP87943.1 hypothetical protein CA2559_04270 [Croceibacter atlanticus HTCC2559]